jgi:hypothetical protein
MTTRQYRAAGVMGAGVFAVALIALHILDSDQSVVEEYLSVYALGDYGWLSRAANLAMGLGLIAVALGLRATLTEGKRVAASWILILAAGVGFIISGIFNTDPTNTVESTTGGALHDLGGYISMLSIMIATWLLRGVFKRDVNYSDLYRTQTCFALLMTSALVTLMTFESILGLTQRVFVAVVVTWLVILAINIRSTAEYQKTALNPARSGVRYQREP